LAGVATARKATTSTEAANLAKQRPSGLVIIKSSPPAPAAKA
jgi:hypothetical protein